MKLLRKLLADPYIYFLLALNLYLVYAFSNDPKDYTTIIWLYWCQSVLIGFFNFFDLLTTRDLEITGMKLNGRQVNGIKGKGSLAFFFLVHYNVFHLVYFFFLASDYKFSVIDLPLFKLALMCIFLGQALLFFQRKWNRQTTPATPQSFFIFPYLRILPMHLMIMLPAFLGFNPALIFLVLKTIFDLAGYVITAGYWQNEKGYKNIQSLFFSNTST